MNKVLLVSLILLCSIAAILELRCLLKRPLQDSTLALAGRRIKIAGYSFLVIRFVDLLLSSSELYAPSALALCLVAFADCIRCANRLHLPYVRFY